MAETKMVPVGANFQAADLVRPLTEMYQAKGFEVMATQAGNNISVNFSKDTDGVKKFMGLGQGVTANMSVNNGTLVINFTDAEWLGKILAVGVGWFLCMIPFFTGIYGVVKQSDLPKKITTDIRTLVSGGPQPIGR